MGDRQVEMAPGLTAGRLEGLQVPDLMWALCRSQADGVLRVTREGVRKTLYLERGRIVFAASSDPDDRLGELLLRKGWVRLEQLEEALGALGSGKRLGTILVEAGHLSPENLVNGVLTQVREIAMDLFTWESGEYGFEPGPLPTQEVITLEMGTGELLLQGIRRIRSFSRIRRSVGPPRTAYRARPGARAVVEGLSLTSGEEQMLARIEDGSATVEALCQDVYLSNFEVYQALWALKVLGAVEVEDRPGTLVDDAAVAGRFRSETLAPVLVRLCRSGETGVLYLTRGTLERTVHLRAGQVVFATSNDIDDGLVAYLLRRGVISLRDREETAKRLLSNKRVGTILREMGVIDDLDLRNMVREHLCEILHDTLSWPDGEYAFVPGELPTVEEITLDVSIESLVAAGLHRITSWSRVRDGIGGVKARLALSPDFLAVLDRMSIGPAEWEVVTSLKAPRSVLEVCGETGLGDFRVAQILWSLRVLGAVRSAEDISAAAADDGVPVTLPAALALDDGPLEAVEPEFTDAEHFAASETPESVAGPTPDATFALGEPGEGVVEDDASGWAVAEGAHDGPQFEVAAPGEGPTEDEAAASWLPQEPVESPTPSFEVGAPGDSGPALAWLPDDDGEASVAEAAAGAGAEAAWEVEDVELAASTADQTVPSEESAAPSDGHRVEDPSGGASGEVAAGADGPDAEGTPEDDDVPALDAGVRDVDAIWMDDPTGEDDAGDGTWGPEPAAVVTAETPGDPWQEPDVVSEAEPAFETSSASEPWEDAGAEAAAEPPDDPWQEPGAGSEAEAEIEASTASEPWEDAAVEAAVEPPGDPRQEPDAGSEAEPAVDASAASEPWEDADVEAPPPGEATQVLGRDEVDAALGREFSADVTQAIDPEVVRAALAGPAKDGDAVEVAAVPVDGAGIDGGADDWTPPDDLEGLIARFNARQRVLYRSIRAEVGAGAVNFVRSCCGKVASAPPDPFDGADLRTDGTWDADALRKAAIEQRIDDPWGEYERLLELEFEMLRIHIGEARAQALREQMDRASAQPAR